MLGFKLNHVSKRGPMSWRYHGILDNESFSHQQLQCAFALRSCLVRLMMEFIDTFLNTRVRVGTYSINVDRMLKIMPRAFIALISIAVIFVGKRKNVVYLEPGNRCFYNSWRAVSVVQVLSGSCIGSCLVKWYEKYIIQWSQLYRGLFKLPSQNDDIYTPKGLSRNMVFAIN